MHSTPLAPAFARSALPRERVRSLVKADILGLAAVTGSVGAVGMGLTLDGG